VFNREKSGKNKTIHMKNKIKLTRITAFFLATASLIALLISKNIEKNEEAIRRANEMTLADIDYSRQQYEYWKRVIELSSLEYDQKIVKLYNGFVSYKGNKKSVNDFYIVYKLEEGKLKCILVNTKDGYKNFFDDSEINFERDGIIKLKDTTYFIELINSEYVLVEGDTLILMEDKLSMIQKLLNNWDGYLHDQTKETKALTKRKVLD